MFTAAFSKVLPFRILVSPPPPFGRVQWSSWNFLVSWDSRTLQILVWALAISWVIFFAVGVDMGVL